MKKSNQIIAGIFLVICIVSIVLQRIFTSAISLWADALLLGLGAISLIIAIAISKDDAKNKTD
jgi:hypothetical protein